MKAPFRLHEDISSADTVEFLEDMLARAKRGEILGGTGSWMLKSRQLIMHTTGEPGRSPVYAIGMLVVLILKLARRVLK